MKCAGVVFLQQIYPLLYHLLQSWSPISQYVILYKKHAIPHSSRKRNSIFLAAKAISRIAQRR